MRWALASRILSTGCEPRSNPLRPLPHARKHDSTTARQRHAFRSRRRSENGIFPLSDIVQIDPDIFKPALPEWEEYARRDPLTAGFHTRKETGFLVEIAQA